MPLTPRSIVLHGRRWFRRGPGNTYHSVEIIVDGETVHIVPYAYGYGQQYEHTARQWLKREGYLPGIGDEVLWRYCDRVGCKYLSDVEDVRRRKDLHRELPESKSRRRVITRRITVPHARCTPERCLEHEYRADVEPCV